VCKEYYTNYQMYMWMLLTNSKFDLAMLKKLSLLPVEELAFVTIKNDISFTEYLSYGVFIGNISFNKDDEYERNEDVKEAKLAAKREEREGREEEQANRRRGGIVGIMESKRDALSKFTLDKVVQFSDAMMMPREWLVRTDVSAVPLKFSSMLLRCRGRRAVFYSQSMPSGMRLFMDYLDSENVKYLFLAANLSSDDKMAVLKNFKEATGECLLMLHPLQTEGITVHGAEQLHIMEPILNYSTYQQLIARIVRFKSHDHLEMSQRKVAVIQWMCTVPDIELPSQTAAMAQAWRKLRSNHTFIKNHAAFSQRTNPDQAAMMRLESTRLSHEAMMHYFTKTVEVAKNISDVPCCINYFSKEQQRQCLTQKRSCGRIRRRRRISGDEEASTITPTTELAMRSRSSRKRKPMSSYGRKRKPTSSRSRKRKPTI
jgi:hypothetical protein